MVSRPERNLTYSLWMSDRRTGGLADNNSATPARSPPASKASARPPVRPSASVAIAHPPDPSARVVRDQQRAVRQHQQPRWPAPVGIRGQPTHDEVGDRDRHATLHL